MVCGVEQARKIIVPHDFPTIFAAIQQAEPGDTVYVKNGKYHENISLKQDLVLQGQDKTKTIIDGGGTGAVVIGAEGAVITGFTITNGAKGILCKNTRPVISRNIILDNKGTGIHAIMSLPQIENNIIYRNKWTGIFLESVRGTRTAIDHNVIVENGYCGIFCAHHTAVAIHNNIITGNKQYAVFVGPGAKKTRIVYNDIYNNRAPFNPLAMANQTNISEKPMFVSPGFPHFNYYVEQVSPCKGKGQNNSDIGLIPEEVVMQRSQDADGDGILDDIDQCPKVAEDKDGFQDEDGCPDYDNDNDGIYDKDDTCPDEAEDKDGFQDQDGCPDNDNDRDGIVDSRDKCPNNPETVNGYKDQDGCPDEEPKKITKKLTLRGVHFKTGSAKILKSSYPVLDKVFNSLEAFPNKKFEIAGHTDNRGGDEYNRILSYKRAKAVKDYFVQKGISTDRLIARGYGEEKPVATNETAEGRAENRRVEIVPTN
jgi:outer membrane protein OmpA-like peptidoglycan-associated protein